MDRDRIAAGIGEGNPRIFGNLNFKAGNGGGPGMVKFLLKYFREGSRVLKILVSAGSPISNGRHQLLIEFSADAHCGNRKLTLNGG